MSTEEDFRIEFIEKFSQREFDEVELMLDNLLADNVEYQEGKTWRLSADIEKVNALNYNYYINLSKDYLPDEDIEVNLEYQSGDFAGTVLNFYSLEGAHSGPPVKIVSVLVDLEIDEDMILATNGPDTNLTLVKMILNDVKDDILEIYRKKSYDEYVTGGGTSNITTAYKDQFQKFHDRGLYWKCIYEDQECDRNYI